MGHGGSSDADPGPYELDPAVVSRRATPEQLAVDGIEVPARTPVVAPESDPSRARKDS